jgi:hypothetical protein
VKTSGYWIASMQYAATSFNGLALPACYMRVSGNMMRRATNQPGAGRDA